MKRDIAPVALGSLCFRLIRDEDLETTLAWRNRDEARVWFKNSDVISIAQHRSWFQCYQERGNDFLFVIEVSGRVVGQASVYGIDWERRVGEVGRFLVAPEAAGQGYIRRACELLIALCKEQLGLRELFLEVFEDNARALHIYKANGFVEETRSAGLIRMTLSLRGR